MLCNTAPLKPNDHDTVVENLPKPAHPDTSTASGGSVRLLVTGSADEVIAALHEQDRRANVRRKVLLAIGNLALPALIALAALSVFEVLPESTMLGWALITCVLVLGIVAVITHFEGFDTELVGGHRPTLFRPRSAHRVVAREGLAVVKRPALYTAQVRQAILADPRGAQAACDALEASAAQDDDPEGVR